MRERHCLIGLVGLLLAGLGLGGCRDSVPASLLLTLVNGSEAPAPDRLRLRVFDGHGSAHEMTAFPAPAAAAGGRLGTVVVYPRPGGSLSLRLQAHGLQGDAVVSEGTLAVTLAPGNQRQAEIVLGATGADADADGVADAIDNCPGAANPAQADADGDGQGDGCAPTDGGTPTDGGPPGGDDAGPPADAPAEMDAADGPLPDGPLPDGPLPDGPDPADGGSDATDGPAPLGAPCSSADQCASGFCADQVCCNSACTTPCRRCDGTSAGTCQIINSGRDQNASPPCVQPNRCVLGSCQN